METWIESRADLLGGKPCIRGTRISVELILDLLANGSTPGEILDAYPHVSAEGLRAALRYAARSLRNEVVWDFKTSA